MSQRNSEYERRERDLYETPTWVTRALVPHISSRVRIIWEPACGVNGKMVEALNDKGFDVFSSDIEPNGPQMPSTDFLRQMEMPNSLPWCDAIITNPPYELGTEFCEHAVRLMERAGGFVAMLMRTDFDHAKSRTHLFRDCPAFAKKVVLMKRIAWFVEANGKPKASPSFNHAWYIWDWRHEGPPVIAYGPSEDR